MNKVLKRILFLLLIFCCDFCFAQYYVPEQGNLVIHTCSGYLKNSPDTQAQTNVSRNGYISIFPGTPGYKIKLTISYIGTDNSDYAEIFNGPDTNSIKIGTYSYENPVTVFSSDSSGALTIRIKTYYDNRGLGLIAMIECIAPETGQDLYTNVRYSYQPSLNDHINFNINVVNKGPNTVNFNNHYYLSHDEILDSSDSLFETQNSLILSSNTGTYMDIARHFFNSTPGGYFTLVKVDGAAAISENDEDNNIMAIPLEIDTPFIDLQPARWFRPLTTIIPGSSVQFDFQIANFGNQISQAFDCRLYFSDDTILDTNDLLISTIPINGVSPGQYIQTFGPTGGSVYFPPSLPHGLHYLLLVADISSQVVESNEQNNINVSMVLVQEELQDLWISKAGISNKNAAPGGLAWIFYSQASRNSIWNNNLNFYLSTDTVSDSTDISLSTALADNSFPYYYYNNPFTLLKIPDTVNPGDYYILLKTDAGNSVLEINENNNTLAVPLTLESPAIDLQFERKNWNNPPDLDFPNHFIQGQVFPFDFNVYNAGNTRSDSCKSGVFLSTDTIFDTLDNPIVIRSARSLYPESQTTKQNGTGWLVPNWLSPGKYYIITVIDVYDSIPEINESNNIHVDTFYVDSINPDIYFSGSINFYGSDPFLHAGDTIGFHLNASINSYVYYNLIPNVVTKMYLTTKQFIDSSALPLTPPILSTNWPYNNSLILPTGIPDGNYYIATILDESNVFSESNENNNVNYTYVSIYNGTLSYDSLRSQKHDTLVTCQSNIICKNMPDSSLLTLMPGIPGNMSSLQFFSSHLPFSRVDVFDGMDTTALCIASLSGNDYPISTLYASSPSGALTIRSKGQNIFSPARFAASVSCVDTIPLPELSFGYSLDNYSIRTKISSAGEIVPASFPIQNLGGMATGPLFLGVYLSDDDSLSSFDMLLNSFPVGNLSGANDTLLATLTQLPAALTVNEYYLIYKLDYNDQVSEMNELNNIYVSRVAVTQDLPDFVLEESRFNKYGLHSNPYSVQCRITLRNLGGISIDSISVGLFISQDSLLDSFDILLDQSKGKAISKDINSKFRNISFESAIPSTLPSGNYFLILIADYQDSISESNESNNAALFSIKLIPKTIDFEITSLSALYDQDNTGRYIKMNPFRCSNYGSWQEAIPARMAAYLSADTILDAGDLLIDTNYVLFSSPAHVSIPAAVTSGNYYLICKIDFDNAYPELNENNNISYAPVLIQDNIPDLVLKGASIFKKTAIGGEYVDGVVIYSSLAGKRDIGFELGIYLSQDTILDGTDLLFSQESHSTFSYGEYKFTLDYRTHIPDSITSGHYFLFFKMDWKDSIPESNELNNTLFKPIYIKAGYKDLVVKKAELNTNYLAPGFTVIAEATAHNKGNTRSDKSRIGYYLSTDSLIDVGDQLIGHSYDTYISQGSYSYKSTLLTIPSSMLPGNYFILFYVDDSNSVVESVESNNIKSIPISVGSPFIDLTLLSPTVSNQWLVAADSINLTILSKNLGNVYAMNNNMNVFFSRDTLIDSQDYLLKFSTGGALAANCSELRNIKVNIPAQVDTGNYFILFVADYGGLLAESNELNNIAYVAVNVSLVGIRESVENKIIRVAPNPFSDKLKIEFNSSEKRNIQIYDVAGRILFSKKNYVEKTILIQSDKWAEGIYSIQVEEAEKNHHSKMIKIY